MTTELCCKAVWHSAYRSHPCGKTAKFEVAGKHFCGIHNPNKNPTKAQIEAEENYRKRQALHRIESAAPDLLAALQGVIRVADRATDEFDAARAAIAKATGAAK